MLPKIANLMFHPSKCTDDYLMFVWLNPEWSLGSAGPQDPFQSQVVGYRLYFLSWYQGMEGDLARDTAPRRAVPLKFKSHPQGTRLEGETPGYHLGRIFHDPRHKGCWGEFHFFDSDPPSQFRERYDGWYALQYKVRDGRWSPLSNVLYDRGASRIHQLQLSTASSGSVSAGPVGLSFMTLGLRDPHIRQTRWYDVVQIGMTAGLSVGVSAGDPEAAERPENWMRFKPRRHLHLEDFDKTFIRIEHMGFGAVAGYAWDKITFYETEEAAFLELDSYRLAGPIRVSGFQIAAEVTFGSEMVGQLRPVSEKSKR